MNEETRQFSTFYIANRMYGINVMRVQEITKALPMARIPLAPHFVHGLINLRGQIAVAIGLRELFEFKEATPPDQMNVVCKLNEVLASFLVDRIGDVMEIENKNFEPPPATIPEGIRNFLEGVYKIPGSLLTIINVDKISEFFSKSSTDKALARPASPQEEQRG